MGWEPEGNRSSSERVGLVGEAESATEFTSMPLVTGELGLLPGIDQRRVLAGRITNKFCLRLLSFSSGERWVRPTFMCSGSPILKGAVGVSKREAGITGDQGREGLRGG